MPAITRFFRTIFRSCLPKKKPVPEPIEIPQSTETNPSKGKSLGTNDSTPDGPSNSTGKDSGFNTANLPNEIKRIHENNEKIILELQNINAWIRKEEQIIKEERRLLNWLFDVDLYPCAKSLLVKGYTLEDVLYYVTQKDLRNSGLEPEVQFQVWREIAKYRALQRHERRMNARQTLPTIFENLEMDTTQKPPEY